MQVTETLSDGLKRGYSVVVPAADIESRRSKRLAELGRTLRLPGFRPGQGADHRGQAALRHRGRRPRCWSRASTRPPSRC